MSRQSYDRFTLALHWISTVLVVMVYALGLAREEIPKGELRNAVFALHMSLGIAMMALMALRLPWRALAPKIEPVPMAPAMALAAKAGHFAPYALLVALPMLGIAAVWAKGRALDFFGLALSSPFVPDRNLAHLVEDAHQVLAHGLMVLVLVHAAAAIYHHAVLGDGVMRRMVPFLARPRA